jgi:hypothetical protein
VFTLSHAQLKLIAETYRVPALVPHSLDPEDYRDRLVPETSLKDEVDLLLKDLFDEGGEE